MQYTTLGKNGPKISRLSMGCCRLPEDDDASTAVIRAALDAGVNFFETAAAYCNGRCVEKTGMGIKGRRDEIMVQVKSGINPENPGDNYRRDTEDQFKRMGIDRAEFAMIGWVSWEQMPLIVKKGGVLEAIRKLQDEKLVKYVGFTGHDSPEGFIKLLETGIFDSITVSYNLVNRMYEKTLDRAGELGIGVIVMNPVGGGMFATPNAMLQNAIPGGSATTASAALRFVLSHPAVSTACSGMNTLEQVRENVAVETQAPLSAAEMKQVLAILDEYHELGQQFCTGCNYCMPCPRGVEIPINFRVYNYHRVYGLLDWARSQYASFPLPKHRAGACVRCGQCEPKCPQKIKIMDQLELVHKTLVQ